MNVRADYNDARTGVNTIKVATVSSRGHSVRPVERTAICRDPVAPADGICYVPVRHRRAGRPPASGMEGWPSGRRHRSRKPAYR